MLIVYGATAGVSVVQLYAGAFFPGLMLAGLYIVYVIVLAKLKPALAPPLSAEARRVELPGPLQRLSQSVSRLALPGLVRGVGTDKSLRTQLFAALLPALGVAAVAIIAWRIDPAPATTDAAAMASWRIAGTGYWRRPARALRQHRRAPGAAWQHRHAARAARQHWRPARATRHA